MRIGIAGLGIGGATAGAAMVRRGIDVTIFEQASEIREVGAGIGIWPNTVRSFIRLGLGDKLAEIGCPVGRNAIRDSSGRITHYVPSTAHDDTPGYYLHRAELLQTVASLIPSDRIRLGRHCARIEQRGETVQVFFDDGSTDAFDAVIGADGIRSTTIAAVTEASSPIYSNLAAYRGLVPNDGKERLETASLWTDREKYFIAFPVSGGRLANFVGVVPTEGKPEESWFMSGSKHDLAAEYGTWDPVVRGIIDKVPATFRWGLYFREPLERIVKGRIALLGDAAHPMLINAGQGAGQAIEDGFSLAVLLEGANSETVESRLRMYEALRLPRATEVQSLSRRNAQFMHKAFPLTPGEQRPERMSTMEWIVNFDVEREAAALLAQTAALFAP